MAAARVDDTAVRDAIERVQRDLFALGALLASPDPRRRKGGKFELPAARIAALESEIDAWEEELPPLTTFILPGGSQVGASLHASRTICRRAERAIVALEAEDLPDTVIPYVNRLSDWLFVLARLVNRRADVEEKAW